MIQHPDLVFEFAFLLFSGFEYYSVPTCFSAQGTAMTFLASVSITCTDFLISYSPSVNPHVASTP